MENIYGTCPNCKDFVRLGSHRCQPAWRIAWVDDDMMPGEDYVEDWVYHVVTGHGRDAEQACIKQRQSDSEFYETETQRFFAIKPEDVEESDDGIVTWPASKITVVDVTFEMEPTFYATVVSTPAEKEQKTED